MATIQTLSNRLRAEIGDVGKSFTETFTGDGFTNRFQLAYAPVRGASIRVTVNGVNMTSITNVEEVSGLFQLAATPPDNAVITVSGVAFKYFTDEEIQYYVAQAFYEHAHTETGTDGMVYTLPTLPLVDEFPLVILASSMALYTLATDASFDIDISSPDGVTIPRSERYRQLMEIVQARKDQYKELCSMLNIGMYRMEVQTLRRVSRLTNRYVPIYKPQEVDDGSIPQRVWLSMPTYGDQTPAGPAVPKDLEMYAGDDFISTPFTFDQDLTNFDALAQIRLFPQQPDSQVGPLILGTFTITKSASRTGGILDTLTLYLPGEATADLPMTAYWDLRLHDNVKNLTKTFLAGKVFTTPSVSNSTSGEFN